MIQSIKIKSRFWFETELPYNGKKVRIEISSEEEVDAGILNQANLDVFYASSSDKKIKKFAWIEEEKNVFAIESQIPDDNETYSLVIWNAYSDEKIYVTYEINVLD